MARTLPGGTTGTTTDSRYRHEYDLVEAAIALVASGQARRISLVLQHAPTILGAAQARGRASGVIVRAAWQAPGPGCDLVVETVA